MTKDFLFQQVSQFYPIFSFFIQKVDKLKRKHSRGKSPKLKLIWKYIPLYKRFYQSLRWLIKDLKFQKEKTFKIRLFKVLETFYLMPELTFLWKLRNFIHIFVFKNYKLTLLKTLRSVT